MRSHILDIETIVPVNHVLTHIISLLVMSSQAGVSIALNVIVMARVVAADHFFEGIALLKLQAFEADDRFQDTLASFILCHKLDQLIYDSLQVGVSFIAQFAVAVKVHKQLHPFSFGVTCLTKESEEKESSGKDFQLFVVDVDVESVLSGPVW